MLNQHKDSRRRFESRTCTVGSYRLFTGHIDHNRSAQEDPQMCLVDFATNALS